MVLINPDLVTKDGGVEGGWDNDGPLRGDRPPIPRYSRNGTSEPGDADSERQVMTMKQKKHRSVSPGSDRS